MHQLTRLLDRACAGEAVFALITGEAGIGKTRLLHELEDLADQRGCLILAGRATEFERELPFALFIDAFDAYLGSLEDRLVERLAMDRLGALAAVFPSLSAIAGAVEYPISATDRFRLHHAVRELTERLAAARPVIIGLEDLQWSDAASLELLVSLARRPPAAGVMVLMTRRSGAATEEVERALAVIQRIATMDAFDLGPLPLEVAAELLGRHDTSAIEAMYRECGGNPFYMQQLGRSETTLDVRTSSVAGVPRAIIQAIAGEVDGVSTPARRLLEAGAVIGDPFELDVVARTCDIADEVALELADELVARDLVRATTVPRRFEFRHPLVRTAVYESTRPGARLRAHDRAAQILVEAGAPIAAVAVHLEQSARPGERHAFDLLRRAGDDSIARAPGSAVRWLRAALRLAAVDLPLGERMDLLRSITSCELAVGNLDAARAVVREWLDIAPVHSPAWVEATMQCARVEQLLGQHTEARARLERAHNHLDRTDRRAAAEVAITLAAGGFLPFEAVAEDSWAAEAVRLSVETGDDGLRASALCVHALSTSLGGRVDDAMAACTHALDLVRQLPDDVLRRHITAFCNLAEAHLHLDLHAEARRVAQRGLDLARATGRTEHMFALNPTLGSALFMIGEVDLATSVLDEALEAARLTRSAQIICWAVLNRNLVASLCADLPTAMALGTESLELAQLFDRGLVSAFAGAIHAQTLLAAGDPAAAIELMVTSGGGPQLPSLAGSWRPACFEVLARAHLSVDETDAATAATERAIRAADELGTTRARLMASRAAAELALARGDSQRAHQLATEALAMAEQIGAAIYIGHACLLVARAAAATDGEEAAREMAGRAASIFEMLGASQLAGEARSRLDSGRGASVRRPVARSGSTVGLDAISGRELEVGLLVVERLTNREIADQLFLSIKTVESHIRSLFNKLSVTSRRDLALTLDRARKSGAVAPEIH